VRTYHAKGIRVLSDGSLELEGPWSAVRFIALLLALVLALLLLLRNRLLTIPTLAFSLYFAVMPTRRRIVFDKARREILIEHAGPFRENTNRIIRFDEILSLRFVPAGRMAGRPVQAMVARLRRDDVYLMTIGEGVDGPALEGAIASLLEG